MTIQAWVQIAVFIATVLLIATIALFTLLNFTPGLMRGPLGQGGLTDRLLWERSCFCGISAPG